MNFLPASVLPGAPTGATTLGIRPEYVRLAAANEPGAVAGTVTQAQDIGTYWLLTAQVGADQVVRARLSTDKAIPKVGESVWLGRRGLAHLLLQERGVDRMKPVNQKAWFLILPVVLCVAFSAILPLMTVVNYSVQDIISPERRVFVGTEWFKAVMRDSELHGALLRQMIGFSFAVLLVEDTARHRPGARDAGEGLAVLAGAGADRDLAADPVERGRHDLADLRPRRHRLARRNSLQALGSTTTTPATPSTPGSPCMVMDVWHWTPLVALLCYAGLRSIPDAYYQAARIDGASKFAVFRYIQLPKMRGVLMIAVLLRFMDSFMIYTEPFVLTGGGPGNATTFLRSVPDAEGGRPVRPRPGGRLLDDLLPDHPAAVLHPLQLDAARRHGKIRRRPAMDERRFKKRFRSCSCSTSSSCDLPIYWMVNMSVQDQPGDPVDFSLWPQDPRWNYRTIFTDRSWYNGYINSLIYVAINTVDLARRRVAGGLRVLALPVPRRQASSSSGC